MIYFTKKTLSCTTLSRWRDSSHHIDKLAHQNYMFFIIFIFSNQTFINWAIDPQLYKFSFDILFFSPQYKNSKTVKVVPEK